MKEIGTLAEIENWGQRSREEEIGRGKKEEGVTGWVSQAGPMWKSVQMSIKVRLQTIKDLIRLLNVVQLMKCNLLEYSKYKSFSCCRPVCCSLPRSGALWPICSKSNTGRWVFRLRCHALGILSLHWIIYSFLQIQQYKAIKYDISPLSPISRHRLNMVRKKVGGRLTEEGRGWDVCLGAGVRPWWNIDPLPSRWSREAHSETGHTSWFHIKGQWSPCMYILLFL